MPKQTSTPQSRILRIYNIDFMCHKLQKVGMKIALKRFVFVSFSILFAASCFAASSYIDFTPVADDTSALVHRGSMIRVGFDSSSSYVWSYGGDYDTRAISFSEILTNKAGVTLRAEHYSYGPAEGTFKYEVFVDGHALYWDAKDAGFRISAYITQRQYGAYTVYPPSQFHLGIRYIAMSDEVFKSKDEAGQALVKLGFSKQFVAKVLAKKTRPLSQLQKKAQALGIMMVKEESELSATCELALKPKESLGSL